MKRVISAVVATLLGVAVLSIAMPKAVHGVVTTLVTVANTATNPVITQSAKASEGNFLTIQYLNGGFSQVKPDGSTVPYSIPAGQELVATDFAWMSICETSPFGGVTCGKSLGDSVTVGLGNTNSAVGYMGTTTYDHISGGLIAGRTDTLKSGLVLTQLTAPIFLPFGASGNGEEVFIFTMHGYLVPAGTPAE